MNVVAVKTARPYNVIIGDKLLEQCGERIRRVHEPCRVLLVSDDHVFPIYGGRAMELLKNEGFGVSEFVFKSGEASKNIQTYGAMLETAAERGLTRSDMIVALGGGVAGDMAGFCAATYMRGIEFVQMPTTLLAAVDASVGGKTAIDLAHGKNLAGAFYQPSLVLCDTSTFSTLPKEVFADGAAEALKNSVLCGCELFSLTANNGLMRDIETVVTENVRFKSGIVAADERESSQRKLLNLGHTFGHAVELLSGFSVSHGRAVAMGLAAAARASVRLGFAERGVADELIDMLRALGLPEKIEFGAQEMADAMLSDKKRGASTITLVLIRDIGDCFLHEVGTSDLIEYVRVGL